MPKRYRQLQVKDLPKVPTWRLERDSNPRPSGRTVSPQPMRHHVQHVLTSSTVLSLSSAAVLNLLRLKAHFVNFVSVREPPLKIVPLVNNCRSKALLCYHITLYKIIGHRHIICFMLPSGCFIVAEIKKMKSC